MPRLVPGSSQVTFGARSAQAWTKRRPGLLNPTAGLGWNLLALLVLDLTSGPRLESGSNAPNINPQLLLCLALFVSVYFLKQNFYHNILLKSSLRQVKLYYVYVWQQGKLSCTVKCI